MGIPCLQQGSLWGAHEMRLVLCFVVVSLWGLGELGVLVHGSPRNMFRTGAILAASGNAQGMVFAEKGYKYGVEEINLLNGGKGFAVRDAQGKDYYFKFTFDSKDDESDADEHEKLIKSLLMGKEPVDFLFGSHPQFALRETQIANQNKRINVQCCVGPDAVYEQNLPYVFGIQVSNKKYAHLTIQSMRLRGIKRVAVIYRRDNLFTSTTCIAALEYISKLKDVEVESMKSDVVLKYVEDENKYQKVFGKFVKDCKEKEVEAVIACSFHDDGKLLVEAFHSAQMSMKAFFMTIGPASEQWVEQVGEQAEFLLSAAQWHKKLSYSDPVFGSPAEYTKKYEAFHGDGILPNYVSAGASAALYVMMVAIQKAFAVCDLSLIGNNVDQLLFDTNVLTCKDEQHEKIIGYERVRRALEVLELETFFGKLKFNDFRRNVGSEPATTQVLQYKEQDRALDHGIVELNIASVLPVTYANAGLVMPSENKYKPTCLPGYYVGPDGFDPCQPCQLGAVSDQEDAPHCSRCPAGSYASEKGQSQCSSCPRGTTTDGPGAKELKDCYCIQGFYADEGNSGVECHECPDGTICNGSTILPFPKRGYWMNNSMHVVAYECESESVCIGGPESACKTGYIGRMCSECSEGYYGVNNYCFECPPKSTVVTFIVLVVLSWYVINVVVSKNVASLEMILSWAQLANVIGDVDLHWPSKLQVMFGVANLLDFDVDILEPSCLTNWSFKHNTVVQLLLPFFMSLLAFWGYFFSWLVHKCKRYLKPPTMDKLDRWLGWLVTIPHSHEELHAKWNTTVAAFLSSIEVTYLTVAKYSFDVFKCEDIGGVSVLRTAPSVECGTQEHKELKALGVLGTLVYTVGYLSFVSYMTWKLHATRSFHKSHYLLRYGFLYHRFELDYSWTPIVILGRRLLFVLVLVFVNNPGFQAGALAIIINASLMLHVYTAPYVDTYLDVMFSFLLVALMFESFSGVLFYSANLPSSNRAVLEWIVLFIVFVLVTISIYIFVLEVKKKFENQYVKQLHCKDILRREYKKSSSLLRMVSSEARVIKRMISDDLLGTLDSSFLYTAIKKNPNLIGNWDKVNEMLKDIICDESECSYLSRHPVAKFWRKLVDRFPELVDFLALSSKECREHFAAFATTLYRDFYLTNKVRKLPILEVLNWRDRAPMAQWLAMASEADREFFTSFMSELFETVGMDAISTFDEKVANEVAAASLALEESSAAPKNNLIQFKIPKTSYTTRELAMGELLNGRNPLEIQPRPSQLSTVGSFQSCPPLRSLSSLSSKKSNSEICDSIQSSP